MIYDDGNKLVREGYCYGFIGPFGEVKEKEPTWYNVPSKSGDVVTKVVPASGYSAQVITDEFFSKLDKEINEFTERSIERRDNFFEKQKKSFQIINDEEEVGYYTFSSIVDNGDAIGSVILISI